MTSATATDRARVSIAALWFGVTAPAIYALIRLYEVARGEAVDPALIVRQLHTAYYYRCALALWFAAFVAVALADADPERSSRRLRLAALIAVPLAALAAWLAP
jgi:hypothetical protein